jgi:hypothetical protein
MSTNAELIKKADLALSDLATAGKLNPMQADRFIRNLIDQPTVLSQVRTVVMKGSQMKINKIGFGSRILHPAVSSTALADSDRSKPDLSQVELNTKEVIAEVHIPYDVLEDNIEGGNISVGMEQGAGGMHQTIVDLLGARAALDLEELALLGDSGSGDAYLAMQDGFLKLATANLVTASTTISKDIIKAALKAMPTRFLRNRTSMKHFLSVNNETDLRDIYANRVGSFGDANLQNNTALQMFGSVIEPVALMPVANSLFTNPLNLIFGIQRNISIEYDKDITKRVFIIVLTARVDFQIEEVNAVVKTSGILEA